MFEKQTTEVRDQKTGAVIATLTSYDGPTVVVVRRLGWSRLKEAARQHMRGGLEEIREMGGAAVVKEFQAFGGVEAAREKVREATQADPLASYDTRTLLLEGVVTLDGVEKTPEAIDDLEPDVADGIARAVLRRARPGLFETEDARKND